MIHFVVNRNVLRVSRCIIVSQDALYSIPNLNKRLVQETPW